MATARDWLCYMIVRHWSFGFGDWTHRSLRWRAYFALLPYAGNWAYRDVPKPPPGWWDEPI
jgi:hypothetical protein